MNPVDWQEIGPNFLDFTLKIVLQLDFEGILGQIGLRSADNLLEMG